VFQKKTVAVVLAAAVAILGFAAPAAAAEGSAPAQPVAGIAVADPVTQAAADDPAAFANTVAAVEPYLVTDDAGDLRLEVPADVVEQVDAQAYKALQYSVQYFTNMNDTSTAAETTDATTFSIPGAIFKFVKKYWKKIVDIAKRSGKWAWCKAVQCSAGAANALYKRYGGNVAWMVSETETAIIIAGAGCVANL